MSISSSLRWLLLPLLALPVANGSSAPQAAPAAAPTPDATPAQGAVAPAPATPATVWSGAAWPWPCAARERPKTASRPRRA